MGIFEFISGLMSPISKIVEQVFPNEVDKMGAKAELLKIQTAFSEKLLDYETKLLEGQTKIITAEASSGNWLTSSWRPITMLSFVFIVIYTWISPAFGLAKVDIPPELWTVIQIGLGGYIGGRSLEKTVPAIVEAFKSKEKT